LDKFESNFGSPINKLSQRADVADSKIILAPQRKQRHEDASNLLFRREVHSQNNDE
jgi:hypothetical protein